MDCECKHIQCERDLHLSKCCSLLRRSLRLYELAIDLLEETITEYEEDH
jgi:hypothetical protein